MLGLVYRIIEWLVDRAAEPALSEPECVAGLPVNASEDQSRLSVSTFGATTRNQLVTGPQWSASICQ